MAEELRIFSGNTHPDLVHAVCNYLGTPPGMIDVSQFSNENIFVRILENVRGRDVFVMQPISTPVNRSLMELLIMIDAAKRASAERITAVIPHYGYARTDKKDQPRVPITARLVADLITVAGASRVLTLDLHAGQIQGYFNIPVDELTALYILCEYFEKKQLKDIVVVATDVGISKRARDMAHRLKCPLAIIEKRRIDNNDQTETHHVIGDVQGRNAILFDDEIDTAGSITSASVAVAEHGAKEVYACCTHPILSGPAIERISKSPLKEVVVTDSVPISTEKLDKLTVLSLAPVIGEAIHRIHANLSIGAMFH